MKYVEDDGEWFPFTLEHGVRQMCCNCSLVHSIFVRRSGRHYEMKIVRHERATSAARRPLKKKVIIVDEDA